jgi:hypothetical protein
MQFCWGYKRVSHHLKNTTMTSKQYDELYPKLNFLIGIRANFNEFYNSWWTDKCLNYEGDKLSNYYDIFFSRFVTFNSLYNTIIYTKECLGLLTKKTNNKHKIIERGDKEKAITLMAKELTDHQLDSLFEKSEIITSVNSLINILESKKFVITHKAGQQFPADDLLILVKLKHADKKERYFGILELLYNVRCNLFHGSKGYEHDQIELLKPINEIIFYIVDFLYNSFKTMTDSLISSIETEIEKLERK